MMPEGPVARHYKFTGKERDSESGLDNFGKRYLGSSLGRFMTPDPLHIMKQKLVDPQQWNMYAYVRNNPLRFTDPTGMYTTGCGSSDISKCDQNTQNFEKARQAALNSGNDKEVAAAKAYGAYGEKNNVTVGFQTKGDSSTGFTRDTNGKITGVNVSINSKTLSGITADSSRSGAFIGAVADVAHEGSHVQTDRAYINSGFNPKFDITNRQSEIRAYGVTQAVYSSIPGLVPQDVHGNSLDLSNDFRINQYLNSLPPNPQEPLDAKIDPNQ